MGSLFWLHYFRLGPVEWLWRRLTGTDRQLLFDGAVPPPSSEVTHRV
ncbi:MAG: DUF418 domain-containing protein [Candidatus Sedimenticola endophacoides]